MTGDVYVFYWLCSKNVIQLYFGFLSRSTGNLFNVLPCIIAPWSTPLLHRQAAYGASAAQNSAVQQPDLQQQKVAHPGQSNGSSVKEGSFGDLPAPFPAASRANGGTQEGMAEGLRSSEVTSVAAAAEGGKVDAPEASVAGISDTLEAYRCA